MKYISTGYYIASVCIARYGLQYAVGSGPDHRILSYMVRILVKLSTRRTVKIFELDIPFIYERLLVLFKDYFFMIEGKRIYF